MFRKYIQFEIKLLFRNPKNLLLGLFLLLFFPLYYFYFVQTEPITIKEQKVHERANMDSTFNYFPEHLRETPKGQEIYQLLTEQSSLINMQRYYIWLKNPGEDYIRDGLRLNEVRMQLHELGNEGIPNHLIVPIDEIMREEGKLRFLQEHNLPLETNSFVASNYLTAALNTLSGIAFLILLLISGSELLLLEEKHRTVMFGFPMSFMKKVLGKILVHSIFIWSFLLVGLSMGVYLAATEQGMGQFSSPIVIYQKGEFVITTAASYIAHLLIGMLLTTIFIFILSVLLNQLLKNLYANILIGIALYLAANLLVQLGFSSFLLDGFFFINLKQVLAGEIAIFSGNPNHDYLYGCIVLIVITLVLWGIINLINKRKYRRNQQLKIKHQQALSS